MKTLALVLGLSVVGLAGCHSDDWARDQSSGDAQEGWSWNKLFQRSGPTPAPTSETSVADQLGRDQDGIGADYYRPNGTERTATAYRNDSSPRPAFRQSSEQK